MKLSNYYRQTWKWSASTQPANALNSAQRPMSHCPSQNAIRGLHHRGTNQVPLTTTAWISAQAPFSLFWELSKIQHIFCNNTAALLKYWMDFLKIYMWFFLSNINFSRGFIFNFSNRWQAFIKCFKNSPLENPELLLLWKCFSLISNRVMVIFHCQRRNCSTNRWVFFKPLSNQLSANSAGPGSGLCCGPSSWVQLIFWLQMGGAGWS